MTLFGQNLADAAASADLSQDHLPLDLGGVQLYCDGNPLSVALCVAHPDQRTNSLRVSGLQQYQLLRAHRSIPMGGWSPPRPSPCRSISRIPGIFAIDGEEPRVAIAYHTSSYATGTITVDGSIEAGDTGTITIGDRSYTYTVQDRRHARHRCAMPWWL